MWDQASIPLPLHFRPELRQTKTKLKSIQLSFWSITDHTVYLGFFGQPLYSSGHIFLDLNSFWFTRTSFCPTFFIFDQGGPILILAVVAVFPKQALLLQSTQKPRAQKQPPKDMRIRISKFFSVLKNWRSNFFIFTPKRFYEVEILNMAEKVLKCGIVLSHSL